MSTARQRFASARVARLATVGPSGAPHLVPVVFALAGDTVYSAVDRKPKRTLALRRLANVAADPRVCLLADHYADDWSALWWVRADGTARILAADESEATTALSLLAERYPQYVAQPPPGPVLAVDVTRWTEWSAAGG
ncbi:TIGR03668 family PPOX class F420-dependent oxidoreductase [Catellatospora vulcania]|uniref:TIGR03668 family PPOX class F420-dependent oxidoreductase n=1 Tax=Catellatospora vulcania TaxID=1460450 RepID=UPI0012D49C8D|nr:TIGR03668 family PPOX class F420-dependent oxidoreductase [Catellatospora vulcania]